MIWILDLVVTLNISGAKRDVVHLSGKIYIVGEQAQATVAPANSLGPIDLLPEAN